jgi:anti-sigma regulatory factor (Ser/Thr protein kinase)
VEKRVVMTLRLSPLPGSIADARRATDALADLLSETALEDVRLMLSELVTNSIRHGRLDPDDLIEIRSDLRGGSLRTSVRDRGVGFVPSPRTPTSAVDRGWGLFLVSRLADRWGISARGGRTTVWFEVALDRDPRAGELAAAP